MSNEYTEISGFVDEIRFRNEKNGYSVVLIRTEDSMITATGGLSGLDEGEQVTLRGEYTTHAVYGEQFSVSSYTREAPTTKTAILKYLSSSAVKGIGAATAKRIIDKFGDESLEVIENEPERLTELRGISEEKARDLSEQIKKAFGFKELVMYLSPYNVTPERAVRIWKKYGLRAQTMIKNNPYILCEDDIGIPFEKADEIAHKMDTEIEPSYCIRAALSYALRQGAQNGFTCMPRDELIGKCVSITKRKYYPNEILDVINDMCSDVSLYSDTLIDNGEEMISLPDHHRAEQNTAARLKTLMQFPPRMISDIDKRISQIEEKDGIQYAELQKEAITTALTKGALILTGGPGTGKTTTLNAIIRILKESGEKVSLAAPTGRAAQRMSDVTGCEAKTIHRLLEVEWTDEERHAFHKNETNQLSCTALIIDEVSMLDALLMDSVMRAIPLGCRLILVGDSDQLPSVGAGNVLKDLITSDVIPTVALNEIFRQSMQSLIITNAHRINKGTYPVLDQVDSDFFFMPCSSAGEVIDTVKSLCTVRLPNAYGYSPMTDIQVLSPSRKNRYASSAVDTESLNKALQDAVNPNNGNKKELTVGERILRVGDKVMQTRNNYDLAWERDNGTTGSGVFNGEIGVLSSINTKDRSCTVTIDDKTVKYTNDDLTELEHAYCTTIHKSQGNEFTAVIIPLWKTPHLLLYRNLLYTGVTRAKKLLIIIGDANEVAAMTRNEKKNTRYSLLGEFLSRE
ncbi:MAG: ATP-dependent RecD-like DNA helicase [Clostridia bacterium]|nr:ATP-dependent RecD-like DNA helicase [Clostridia bacterium]